ncbi:hypothetical protein D3C77_14850 [compost metagenome]
MTAVDVKSRFQATLLRPAKPDSETSWAFVLLTRDASEQLPRRGRTTIEEWTTGGWDYRLIERCFLAVGLLLQVYR